MRATRVDNSVLVVEVGLSVNLASLTIEQVVGKRRKVVIDMCEQLAIKARAEAQSDEWALLRSAADAFLKERLVPIADKEPEHFNNNKPLGDAIQEAVGLANTLAGWPKELAAVRDATRTKTVETLVHSKEAIALPEQEAVAQSVVEGICALMYALPPEITLHLDFRRRKLEPHGLVGDS